jgi:hypothetical protein
MMTDKEKSAVADLIMVTSDLTAGELIEEESMTFNDGLGDFLKFALERELGETMQTVKLTATERKKVKKELNTLIKSFKAQLYRALDEAF